MVAPELRSTQVRLDERGEPGKPALPDSGGRYESEPAGYVQYPTSEHSPHLAGRHNPMLEGSNMSELSARY